MLRPFLFFSCCLALALAGCKRQYKANAQWQTEIGGACQACPPNRIDTLLRKLDGVVELQYNTQTAILLVRYDSTGVVHTQIIALLNDAGYDAGDEVSVLPNLLDPCCVRDDDDLSLLLSPADTAGMSVAQKTAFMDSLRDVVAFGGGDSLDQLLDDALGADASLDDILRDDLLGNSGDELDSDILPDIADDWNADAAAEDAEIMGGLDRTESTPSRPAPKPTRKPAPKRKPAPAKSN